MNQNPDRPPNNIMKVLGDYSDKVGRIKNMYHNRKISLERCVEKIRNVKQKMKDILNRK